MLVAISILVGLIGLGLVVFIFYANDVQQNVTVTGTYTGPMNFVNSMNSLIAILWSNLGYVLIVLLIILLVVAAIGYIGIKSVLG
jgi:hypothetical protein